MKEKVIVIAGPTAVGKSGLGVKLAKLFNGEIISADSIQIYKNADIGSAKITPSEQCGINHHLLSFLDVNDSFSAGEFSRLAANVITDITSRGKVPIIVGGTGLYVDSLLDNVRFSEVKNDEEYRRELMETARTQGAEVIYRQLAEADPEAAETIHMNNLVRVVRALEVIHVTGRKFSEIKAESRLEESPYDSLILGLNYTDRKVLYDRIDRRVDKMVEAGLIEEARGLWQESGMKTAANAIGYKELIPYFEGTLTLTDCISKIKQETRHYAKRQLTWFRRNERIQWILLEEFSQMNEIYKKSENTIANYKNI